jgi:short-subunit dehydrogenase
MKVVITGSSEGIDLAFAKEFRFRSSLKNLYTSK